MTHNMIVFPIDLSELAGTPTLDDFLAGLREMHAELAECSGELAAVRAGVAEVRHALNGMISQVAELAGRVDEPEQVTDTQPDGSCSGCGGCSCGCGCTCEGMCPCGCGLTNELAGQVGGLYLTRDKEYRALPSDLLTRV